MQTNTFVIMGRPGSGKGTQAKLLADALSCDIASLGTDFRRLMAGDTVVGIRLTAGMNAGELAPTWLADYMCTKALISLRSEEKLVFDSGCRMRTEAILFDQICEWLGREYKIIHIDVSEEEIRRRIAKRGEIEGRADDTAHALDKRIEEFNTRTLPAIEYFRSKGVLLTIDGAQQVPDVEQSVRSALGL